MRNQFSHSVPTMVALSKVTEQFLNSLPAEFTKKEFQTARNAFKGHPLRLQTCRDYGFVVVSRTEPATYSREETVWTDARGREFTYDEITRMDRATIAVLFDCPAYARQWMSLYQLPNKDVVVEHPCERNIFRFNVEKFKRFLEENA